MQKKIAIFSSHPNYGGSEKLWLDLAKHIGKTDIVLLICANSHLKNIIENTITSAKYVFWDFNNTYSNNPLIRLFFFTKRYIAYYQCYNCIKKFKPNSVLINEGNALEFIDYLPFLCKLITSKFTYFPLAHMVNKIKLNTSNKSFIHNYYSKAKKVLFVSNRTSQEVSHNINFDIPNIKIVRNTVGLKTLKVININENIDKINIAIVGSIDKRKNQNAIIQILSQPKWLNRDWILNIYGDGESKNDIKLLIKKLGLEERIHLKGYESKIERIWKINHLNILPSFSESAPISIVEAMICGRPTVATDVGGVSDWIDEQTGFLAKSPTNEDIENALELAWQNRNQWKQIGINAHKKALKMMRNPEKDLLDVLTEV